MEGEEKSAAVADSFSPATPRVKEEGRRQQLSARVFCGKGKGR